MLGDLKIIIISKGIAQIGPFVAIQLLFQPFGPKNALFSPLLAKSTKTSCVCPKCHLASMTKGPISNRVRVREEVLLHNQLTHLSPLMLLSVVSASLHQCQSVTIHDIHVERTNPGPSPLDVVPECHNTCGRSLVKSW